MEARDEAELEIRLYVELRKPCPSIDNSKSLLNTLRRETISEIVDIDLSREEDSVTSLAIAQATDSSITAYVGINSSQAEQEAGKNEHLRSFRLYHPPRKAEKEEKQETGKPAQTSGKTEALGKTSFFKPSTAARKETYQRITRLPPPRKSQSQQIAAIATGLAPESEIVLFRAVSAPQKSDEVARISLEKKEAADLDLTHLGEESSDYILAFCTDTEVYTQKISNDKADSEETPMFAYGVPPPDASARSPARPKFRSMRFLSPRHILLLQNLPQRSGAELLILKLCGDGSLGQVTLQKRLSSMTKAAVGLDICCLSKSPAGEFQVVAAIAGQSGSIEIFTLEYNPSKGFTSFCPFATLKSVHPSSITAIRFSNFIPPPTPVSKDTPAQQIKLASVSVSQCVVVYTLPLQPHPPTKSKTPRYILAPPGTSDTTQAIFSVFMAALVIAIAALLLQAFTEIRGGVPPTLGAPDWLSPRIKALIHRPYIFAEPGPVIPDTMPPVIQTTEDQVRKLHELVAEHASAEKPKAIIVRDGNEGRLSTEVREGREIVHEETLKKWDDLEPGEKEEWKKKLSDGGHWTTSQGENVLKGVLFSELAGVVGDILRG